MKINCYWKRDTSTLAEVAVKAYDICYNIYEKLGYKDWMIYFKKQWNFDVSKISKTDFVNAFVDGILIEDKSMLKRHGYELVRTVSVSFGFTFSLHLKLAPKQTLLFMCGFGVHSPNLTNSFVINFPKGDFKYAELFNSVIKTIHPQWGTLTEEKLYKEIAEFSKDIVPGYLMFFQNADKQVFDRLPLDCIEASEEGATFRLTDDIMYTEEARSKAVLLSEGFKEMGLHFNSFLVG